MIKWKMLPERFQGAGVYNFGMIKITVDSGGYFETNGLPKEPLYAIAKRVWDEHKDQIRQAAE